MEEVKAQGVPGEASSPVANRTVCRGDHKRITVTMLDRELGRGEILLESGEAVRVSERKDGAAEVLEPGLRVGVVDGA